MELDRSLADLLATLASGFLPDWFDHLLLAERCLQRFGLILARLSQALSATTRARLRHADHRASAWELLGKGMPRCPCVGEALSRFDLCDRFFPGRLVFGGARFQFVKSQRQLIKEPARTLLAGGDIVLPSCDRHWRAGCTPRRLDLPLE